MCVGVWVGAGGYSQVRFLRVELQNKAQDLHAPLYLTPSVVVPSCNSYLQRLFAELFAPHSGQQGYESLAEEAYFGSFA